MADRTRQSAMGLHRQGRGAGGAVRPAAGRTGRPADLFRVDPDCETPKYQQVVERVISALQRGGLRRGSRLPSINEACRHSSLSRATVVRAYRELREKRMVSAVHGKGFFLRPQRAGRRLRIFVLFDTLNAYKEKVYAGLVDTISGRADLAFWFHHFNVGLFERLVHDALGKYDRYLVMPFPAPAVEQALSSLEPDRLLLLDIFAGLSRRCAYIVQDFDAELSRALAGGLDRLRRYRRFVLVFPPDRHHPEEIPGAFRRFGQAHGLECAVIPKLTEALIRGGQAYLVIEDDDLVSLVKYCQRTGQGLGRDLGVISYNDTPLKEVVAGGISVVSIDFYRLGVRAAEHVLRPRMLQETRQTRLILRGSL